MQKRNVDQIGRSFKKRYNEYIKTFGRTMKSQVIHNICYKPVNSCGKIEVTMVILSANKKGRFPNILK
jgi:hypothetical protein